MEMTTTKLFLYSDILILLVKFMKRVSKSENAVVGFFTPFKMSEQEPVPAAENTKKYVH